jgi:hypothetical protein
MKSNRESGADPQSHPSLPRCHSRSGPNLPQALLMLFGRGIRDLRQRVRFVRRGWGIDLLWSVMIVVVSQARPLGRPSFRVASLDALIGIEMAQSKDMLTDSNGPRDLFAFYAQGLSGLGTSRRVIMLGRVVSIL